jgi:hypothetical protein
MPDMIADLECRLESPPQQVTDPQQPRCLVIGGERAQPLGGLEGTARLAGPQMPQRLRVQTIPLPEHRQQQREITLAAPTFRSRFLAGATGGALEFS